MTLFADMKKCLRITSDAFDAEVQMLVDAALYDLERVGVNPDLLTLNSDENLDNALVKKAVACYCKANFGYDVAEAPRFDEGYERVVIDLLNSSDNIASIAQNGTSAGLGATLGAAGA